MRTFLIGLAVAVILTAGTAYVFQVAEITIVERSSPSQSVRIDDEASQTAKGTGYGAPEKEHTNAPQPAERDTAKR